MYAVKPTGRFAGDLRRAEKRGCRIELLTELVKQLASGAVPEKRYRDHPLKGSYADCRECHVLPDWLLVYEIDKEAGILYLTRTGTHSDLFR